MRWSLEQSGQDQCLAVLNLYRSLFVRGTYHSWAYLVRDCHSGPSSGWFGKAK